MEADGLRARHVPSAEGDDGASQDRTETPPTIDSDSDKDKKTFGRTPDGTSKLPTRCAVMFDASASDFRVVTDLSHSLHGSPDP